jgi:hypothetical protein
VAVGEESKRRKGERMKKQSAPKLTWKRDEETAYPNWESEAGTITRIDEKYYCQGRYFKTLLNAQLKAEQLYLQNAIDIVNKFGMVVVPKEKEKQ